jgi:hypothetical protein
MVSKRSGCEVPAVGGVEPAGPCRRAGVGLAVGILQLRICFRIAKADAPLRMTTGKDRRMSWHFSDHSPARNLYCASVRGTTLSLPWRTSGDSAKSL